MKVVVKHEICANCANFGAGANVSRFCNNIRHVYVFEAKTALELNFVLFACLVWYWLLESDLSKMLVLVMFW